MGAAMITAVFAVQQIPEPEERIEVPPFQFNEEWNAAASTVALKAASLADTEPKPIKTEAVKSEVTVLSEEKVAAKPKLNVCQRNGMRKVRQGRGWRCRR